MDLTSKAKGEQAPQSRARPILVVEDELLVRVLLADALREEGHEVVEASSADEAVDLLKGGVRVDLIVSDVRMPGSLDGLGLVRFVRQRFAEIPVILTSGHLEPRLGIAEGAARFLAKPYKLETLCALVASELDQLP